MTGATLVSLCSSAAIGQRVHSTRSHRPTNAVVEVQQGTRETANALDYIVKSHASWRAVQCNLFKKGNANVLSWFRTHLLPTRDLLEHLSSKPACLRGKDRVLHPHSGIDTEVWFREDVSNRMRNCANHTCLLKSMSMSRMLAVERKHAVWQSDMSANTKWRVLACLQKSKSHQSL